MKIKQNFHIITIISAIVGLVDSIYLTWVKLSNSAAACLPGIGDCETVNTSRYSEIYGIPIALIGAVAYTMIIVNEFAGGSNPNWRPYALYLNLSLGLIGVIYSAYLTYIEIAVLKAVCPFCVISAIAITVILIGSIFRLFGDQGSIKS